MNYFTATECTRYLSEGDWELDDAMALRAREISPNEVPGEIYQFRIPSDARVRPFAILIARIMGTIRTDGRLLYITEFGIWPSSEDPYLYRLFRAASGDAESLMTKPGHYFASGDDAQFESLLAMSLDFGWGGVIAGTADPAGVLFDHDGRVVVLTRERNESIRVLIEKSRLLDVSSG